MYCQKYRSFYATERKARNEGLDYHGREELRNKASKPVLKGLKAWLLENAPESNSKVVPKSKIGKAISYALGMWGRIERYLEDGKYQIDNNWVENSIRPVGIGKKELPIRRITRCGSKSSNDIFTSCHLQEK
jgi:transposase